jgi:hypothetical protein
MFCYLMDTTPVSSSNDLISLVLAIDSIDEAEVTSALKHLGEYLSPKQVNSLIKEVDTNGNGQIEFGEFIYMVGQIRLGKINVLGKMVSSSKLSVYKFTDAELGVLKTEFGSYDTSGDGRYVCFQCPILLLFRFFVINDCFHFDLYISV